MKQKIYWCDLDQTKTQWFLSFLQDITKCSLNQSSANVRYSDRCALAWNSTNFDKMPDEQIPKDILGYSKTVFSHFFD